MSSREQHPKGGSPRSGQTPPRRATRRPPRPAGPATAAVRPPPPGAADGPRTRVITALANLALTFPDLAPMRLDERDLEARDAALMHAIYDATVRRWSTLEWLIGRAAGRDPRALDAPARAALLAGAAQLLFLDRIPDHAAIHESVEWAKLVRGRGAAGLVNAILRKVAGMRAAGADGQRVIRETWSQRRDELPLIDGRALVISAELLPTEPARRAALATGVSAWLVERWVQRAGIEEATRLAWHSLAGAPVIINAALALQPVPFPLAAGGAMVLHPHRVPGHFRAEGSHRALEQFLAERQDVWVQDPSSSAAIESIRDLKPGLILDLCAGQGTKTRQLAATFPSASIIATDTDAARFETLGEQFRGNERVRIVAPGRLREHLEGRAADLILLDVPCSNTGVLARRIEARHRAGPQQLARLSLLQSSIIDDAVPLLAAGGSILYATCSLEPDENEQVVLQAAQRHSLSVARQRWTVPAGGPGLPATEHTDGSFSALLSR